MKESIDRIREREKMARMTQATWIIFALVLGLVFITQPASGEPLLWPLADTGGVQYKSSGYGVRKNPMGGSSGTYHAGIDLACRKGTGVIASASGIITVCAIKDKVYGTYMVLRTDSGLDILYGHLSEPWYRRGQRVKAGWIIGLSGNTGLSTGPHLHYQVMQDPMELFREGKEWIGNH